MPKKRVKNLVVISDTHIGCKLGLCHPEGFELDEGGVYMPSDLQKKVWSHWRYFWNKWVPQVCHDEPYAVIFNGDMIDGVHHNAVTQVTHNLTFQRRHAEKIMRPIVENKQCSAYYHIRGTEAHGGKSSAEEESLAGSLGAIPNEQGQYARYELWLNVGPALVHVLHHLGATGSAFYESTALNRELTNSYMEAGRWQDKPPDICIRSHRHRNAEVRVPTALGYGICCCTAGWQLKGPLVFRMNIKMSQPQLGGTIVRQGDEDVYTRHYVQRLERPQVENVGEEPA